MTPEQREAVRSNAKYLRGVRPIDPAEVHEYVEGRPHPATVRRVLREEAFDLGLREREDGTFVPASDEPIAAGVGRVERLPERHVRALEDHLVDRLGAGWATGATGDRLRRAIRRLKEDYYRGRDVEYDAEAALGYAVYHLPDYYAAIQYALGDLIDRGLLGRTLRVLDVGAGAGGPALGLFDLLPDDALVEYHAVEPSAPAADCLEVLLAEAGRNVHPTVHRTTAGAFDPAGEYDLLLFANVLSELEAPADVVARYAGRLADDGSILALAPADRETSTGLRSVERALLDRRALSVYSPTIRLWPGREPSSRCWSFDVRPDLEVPAFQSRLDDGSGEFVNVDVQFSYSILRADGARRIEFVADRDRFAPLGETERHVTERIDAVAVKLSHDLADGENPLFLIGDGSQSVDHYAVLARETALNRDLLEAAYADLLVLEGALALWNDDEGAYNLVVDDGTTVDRVGP